MVVIYEPWLSQNMGLMNFNCLVLSPRTEDLHSISDIWCLVILEHISWEGRSLPGVDSDALGPYGEEELFGLTARGGRRLWSASQGGRGGSTALHSLGRPPSTRLHRPIFPPPPPPLSCPTYHPPPAPWTAIIIPPLIWSTHSITLLLRITCKAQRILWMIHSVATVTRDRNQKQQK